MELVNKKSIVEQAREEVIKEQFEKSKEDLKKKIIQLHDAKVIVANLEREIEFIEKKLNQEIGDVSN